MLLASDPLTLRPPPFPTVPRSWCVRNPAYSYQGPPPVSLAERLEALARDARDVSEEDAEIAEEMARQVRDEAEAGAAEAARKAAMEARIDAREA